MAFWPITSVTVPRIYKKAWVVINGFSSVFYRKTGGKNWRYSGLIHSHLVYGLPIWEAATKGWLDTLLTKHKKAIRKIYNLRYRDHTKPYFVKGRILQLPELIKHTTLCYIQSGIPHTSPQNVQKLWTQKQESRELRDTGIKLAFKVNNRD